MEDLDRQIAELEHQLAALKQQRAARQTNPQTSPSPLPTSSPLPLQGIRIVDMSRFLVGPFCTQMLADMGAEVIKVEPLDGGDPVRAAGSNALSGESLFFLARNRNKQSLALDLKHEAGREVVYRLVRTADVFIENFRPGAADKLGFGYDTLRRYNPQLIYCAVSGYGQEGPHRERPGQDLLIQAISGIISITGWEGGPPTTVGTFVADMVGAFHCAYGIAVALLARERLGIGQKLEVSLLDSLLALQAVEATTYLNTGKVPKKAGAGHGLVPPPYRVFEAREGALVIVAPSEDWWQRLCRVPALEDICRDSRFASRDSRAAHETALNTLLEERFRSRTMTEWLALLAEHDVLAAPVYTYKDLFDDPQVAVNDMVVHQDHPVAGPVRVIGIPVKLARTPGQIRTPAPLLGEHTEEILTSLGYSKDEIAQLRAMRVV
ncbi:MAG TPA: CoA transferase [Candidatus Binatia bacterium]|jgi:crotonobetainyl-CoA:carnitine CoA-transferase CaiB-like acyl-CoA transferase|nr:CoA transferase [Candidatus Binatia bacterium]